MTEHSWISNIRDIVEGSKLVDLSHLLEEGMPVWPTHMRFSAVTYESHDFGDESFHQGISLGEHVGTHIDAPCHFTEGAKTVEELPLTQLLGRGLFFDVSFLKKRETLSLERLKELEIASGVNISKGDIVLFRFGWDEKYSLRQDGNDFLQDWPGLSQEVAEYLVENKVKAAGTDALSIDAFGSDSPSHNVFLGNDVIIIETIANTKGLPAEFFVMGFPLKIKGGSGSPIRLVALVKD